MSHRAIILAAMARGTSKVGGVSAGEDVFRTLVAIRQLGAEVESHGGDLLITGCDWRSPGNPIDCGNSGTAARLLLGAIAGTPGVKAVITGDESLRRRPMNRVIAPLVRMGATIKCGPDQTLPILVKGRRLVAITHRNQPASAQVKTALLFAGLGADGMTSIIEPLKSRTHGETLMRTFGCDVTLGDFAGNYSVSTRSAERPKASEIRVSGDPSSAAFPLVAALIVKGSNLRIDNVLVAPERCGLLTVLEKMGARLKLHETARIGAEGVASIVCRSSTLIATDVPATFAPSMIDEYPIAAVAAAYAKGSTIFRGLSELRHKESDRLERIASCLTQCGVAVQIDGNDLIVHGEREPYGNAIIDSHGDHRIAMAFATLGLASRFTVSIIGAEMIGTSFPGFVDVMVGFGAKIGWSQ